MDPPYGQGLAERTLAQLAAAALLRPDGWVAAEHHLEDRLAQAYGTLRLTTARRYGKTVVSLYQNAQDPDDVAET
jgi:16S rRNA G966 N2-methylase RsmD